MCVHSRIDDYLTRLYSSALEFTWKHQVSHKDLYAEVTIATVILEPNILELVGHCYQKRSEVASNPLMWTPYHPY